MNHWSQIRSEARRLHREACAHGPTSKTHNRGLAAADLVARAAEMTGVMRIPVAAVDPLLCGSLATLSHGCVWYNADVESWFANYCQAHEYAHYWLHHGQTHCTRADIEGPASEDTAPVGEGRITGYGPHERREREANIFAREFLLPGDVLPRWFVEDGMNAEAISRRTGMPVEIVCQQMARALLVIEQAEESNRHVKSFAGVTSDSASASISGGERQANPTSAYHLDPSQRDAARAPEGPLLIEAGPGTGKTRTLVGRVLCLLERGVKPDNILALTFSNKAAEEMRERVGHYAPDVAPKIWMGTFHAFGLELLRRYWKEAVLPPKPSLLDPVDALFMLERALPDLRLDHYQNLYEPTTYLKDILGAISRAKDELVGPAHYRQLAEAMLDAASNDEEVETAEKAIEVAHVYDYYQNYLEREQLLDFGDLLFRAVRLLRESDSVREEVRTRYREVLVDEYQDVNRASGLLLREICGEGRGLWSVGDVRQAVYRWRGASTANMRLFGRDFPGAKVLSLKVNYRSQSPIVSTFAELAPHMSAAGGSESFSTWQPNRGENDGGIKFEITENFQAEASYLAEEIRRQGARGIPLSRQAVICRSHNHLGRFAAALEKEGIPVFYLGDIFERPEVRDMLSLLSLSCEGRGRALLRVARFPEYGIRSATCENSLTSHASRRRHSPRPSAWLRIPTRYPTRVSRSSRCSGSNLKDFVRDPSAWRMLSAYLFLKSNYLRSLLADDSLAGRQSRLALYQFLQFVNNQTDSPWYRELDPKLALLKYVRRLEMFGEERNYRQIPDWADNIDAVRMLTIHASKGLEFDAVYLPYLGGRYMPQPRQYQPCPPPSGLIENCGEDEHLEEEQCLFFVALSRARDVLCLTRSLTYGKQKSKASKFLELIKTALPRPADGAVSWRPPHEVTAEEARESPIEDEQSRRIAPPRYTERQLEIFMRCPRQYFYEQVLYMSGKREDSAYSQFHSSVYETIGWLRQEYTAGRIVEEDQARDKLREVWETKGPREHAYEAIYLEQAEMMVSRVVERHAATEGEVTQPEWEITLTNGRVVVKPDLVQITRDGDTTRLVVQRIRTGHPSEAEPKEKNLWPLSCRGPATPPGCRTPRARRLPFDRRDTGRRDDRQADRETPSEI